MAMMTPRRLEAPTSSRLIKPVKGECPRVTVSEVDVLLSSGLARTVVRRARELRSQKKYMMLKDGALWAEMKTKANTW